MQFKKITVTLLLSTLLPILVFADNPSWFAYQNGTNTHKLFAVPYTTSGDYTQVIIGDFIPTTAYTSMLFVMGNEYKQNAIEAWGINEGSKAISGFNTMGTGVLGHSYYAEGIYGICGNAVGSSSGYAGRFKHNNALGIALQVDQGKVNFLEGNTTISKTNSNDPQSNGCLFRQLLL